MQKFITGIIMVPLLFVIFIVALGIGNSLPQATKPPVESTVAKRLFERVSFSGIHIGCRDLADTLDTATASKLAREWDNKIRRLAAAREPDFALAREIDTTTRCRYFENTVINDFTAEKVATPDTIPTGKIAVYVLVQSHFYWVVADPRDVKRADLR